MAKLLERVLANLCLLFFERMQAWGRSAQELKVYNDMTLWERVRLYTGAWRETALFHTFVDVQQLLCTHIHLDKHISTVAGAFAYACFFASKLKCLD